MFLIEYMDFGATMRKSILLACVILLLLSGTLCACTADNLRNVRVAYACRTELTESSTDSAIGYVEHKVVDAPGERLYILTLQLALYDPDSGDLVSPFPDGLIIRGIELDSAGVAHVTFSEAYAALDGMSRTLADSCTLYTLTQFPEINGVAIRAGETAEEGPVLRCENMVPSIEDLRLQEYDITFYFPSSDMKSLVAVNKNLVISEADSLTQTIVEHLILGYRFDTGFRRHISQYTKCLSAQVRSRTCYVDLNMEFLEMNLCSDDGLSLTVYSIVNTLCLLDTVDRVQFLIEGEKMSDVMTEGFDSPMEPDYSLVIAEE